MTRLVRTPYYTSGDFPELSAYYSLTPVALISGKVFYGTMLVGCISRQMEKCERYESNIPQQLYKNCPITAWVLSLSRASPASALFIVLLLALWSF